jgi:hypothetical protein
LDDVRVQLINNSELLVGVVRATDTTINLGWTVTAANAGKFLVQRPAKARTENNKTVVDYAFDFNSVDNTHNYMLYIYTDEACTKLYQSWNCSKDFWHDGATTTDGVTTYKYNYPTRFIISGLTPSTDYYVIVHDTTTGQQSSAVKVSTIAPRYQGLSVQTDPANLAVGNTILFQNFGKLYYGGDLAGYAMGYTVNSAHIGSLTENYNAQGPTPYGNDTRTDFDRCRCEKEHGVFTTCAGLVDDFGMSDWSYFSDDNSCRVCVHPGYIKMGGGEQRGTLVTPQLSVLQPGKTYSIKVRVNLCSYATIGYSVSDYDKLVHITAYQGGEVNDYIYSNGSIIDTHTIDLSTHDGEWKVHEVIFNNITSDCRVGIGGARITAGDSRFFLDDLTRFGIDQADIRLHGTVILRIHVCHIAGRLLMGQFHRKLQFKIRITAVAQAFAEPYHRRSRRTRLSCQRRGRKVQHLCGILQHIICDPFFCRRQSPIATPKLRQKAIGFHHIPPHFALE